MTESRHEKSDVRFVTMARFVVALLVLGFVAHWAVIFLLWGLYADRAQKETDLTPLAKQSPRLPSDISSIPNPRLQVSDIQDMKDLRKANLQKLRSFSWINRGRGIVRIPIQEAIEFMSDPKRAAKHGLVVRAK